MYPNIYTHSLSLSGNAHTVVVVVVASIIATRYAIPIAHAVKTGAIVQFQLNISYVLFSFCVSSPFSSLLHGVYPCFPFPHLFRAPFPLCLQRKHVMSFTTIFFIYFHSFCIYLGCFVCTSIYSFARCMCLYASIHDFNWILSFF